MYKRGGYNDQNRYDLVCYFNSKFTQDKQIGKKDLCLKQNSPWHD